RRSGGEEAGEGDADLDRREELVGLAGQAGEDPPGGALLLEAPELSLTEGDQREFAAGERGVEQHEGGDEQELGGDGGVHAPIITGVLGALGGVLGGIPRGILGGVLGGIPRGVLGG